MQEENKLQLGYWSIRGRGQPIRFLLEYMQVPYTEKRYNYDNKEEWFDQDKNILKPFPNVPYIIDNNFYLSENDSIIKYIVKKQKNPQFYELLGIGKDVNDEFRIDQLVNVINDLRQAVRDVYFSPKYDEIKQNALNATTNKFKQLIEFKGQNDFLLPYLTVADFKLVEVLLYYQGMDEEIFKTNIGEFQAYIDKFYSLPQLQEYLKSERYQNIQEFFPSARSATTGKAFVMKFNQKFL